MDNFYEKLAIYRNNFRANSEEERQEIIRILEMLYDIAANNKKSPGRLPMYFYLKNIHMGMRRFEQVLKDIGIRAYVSFVRHDKQNGTTYQIFTR